MVSTVGMHAKRLAVEAAIGEMLEPHFSVIELGSGGVLFDQGALDDRLFRLEAGMMEVSVISREGRKLALNQLTPGALFGEIAVFDPGPRTARIEALRPSRIGAIAHKTLLDLMARESDLARNLLHLAGQRMRWMSTQLEAQVFMSPSERLADKLIFLLRGAAQIRMSQAQLADHVGVTREFVSKTLSQWRRAGLVHVGRGSITVLDAEGLAQQAAPNDQFALRATD